MRASSRNPRLHSSHIVHSTLFTLFREGASPWKLDWWLRNLRVLVYVKDCLTEILNLSNVVGIQGQRRLGEGLEQGQSGGRACGFGHGEGQRILQRETRPLGEYRFGQQRAVPVRGGWCNAHRPFAERAGNSTAILAGWG